MPFWLILAGSFAGWILWSNSRAKSADRSDSISAATKKSAGLGVLTFAFMVLLRVGPWRAWALLSSAITALPMLARLLQSHQHTSHTDAPRSSQLSRKEAAQLLDVALNAPREEIEAAYRRLMARVHPDAGGNAHLAQLVNEARDRLLN